MHFGERLRGNGQQDTPKAETESVLANAPFKLRAGTMVEIQLVYGDQKHSVTKKLDGLISLTDSAMVIETGDLGDGKAHYTLASEARQRAVKQGKGLADEEIPLAQEFVRNQGNLEKMLDAAGIGLGSILRIDLITKRPS